MTHGASRRFVPVESDWTLWSRVQWRRSQERFWVHAIVTEEQLDWTWMRCLPARSVSWACLVWRNSGGLENVWGRSAHSSWTPGPATTRKHDWWSVGINWLIPMCIKSPLYAGPVAIIWLRFTPSTSSLHYLSSCWRPQLSGHIIMHSSLCRCLCNFSCKPHLSLFCLKTKFMLSQVLLLNNI